MEDPHGFMRGRMEEATALMKTYNGGLIGKDQLLLHLEESLGSKGMDMLALWGIMMANEASRMIEGNAVRADLDARYWEGVESGT